MRILLFVFILLFGIKEANSQNLVPNPSFEDTVQCPFSISQISFATGWFSARGTPDYLNSCSINPDYSTPSNVFGYQIPQDGIAYADISCYGVGFPNEREIASIQLLQNLTIGINYYVSFFVARTNTFSLNGAASGIGLKFTNDAYGAPNPIPIDNQPHIFSSAIIYDTLNWTFISGSFIADSSYSYINIGNFFDDQNTDTAQFNSKAIYYIDMVCVSTDSLTCLSYLNQPDINVFDKLKVYVEDDNIYFLNLKKNITIQIYNIEGQLLIQDKITINPTISIKYLKAGIYILKYYYKNRAQYLKFNKI